MSGSINAILENIEKFVSENQLEEAEQYIQAQESNFKYNAELYSAKSIVYMLMSRFKDAELILKKGLVVSHSNTDLLFNMAYLNEIQGEFIKAVQYYHKARIFAKNTDDYKKITELITGIENQHKDKIKEQSFKRQSLNFSEELINKLIEGTSKYFTDNYDYDRFEKVYGCNVNVSVKDDRYFISDFIDRFDNLYNSLSDDFSRDILIEVIALRILGNKHIRLSLSDKKYFEQRKEIESILDKHNSIGDSLYYCNLSRLGYPIELYASPLGVQVEFISKQYEYNKRKPPIKVESDDIVLDCGGCYGDTALRFAYDCGFGGKVYSFEFIQANLDIMNRNLSLNEDFKDRICVVNNPVYDISGEKVFAAGTGPATFITSEAASNEEDHFLTVSIDDFVRDNELKSVGFIKMDIEGSELKALMGAKDTIVKYKPKLAVTIYHNITDFITIFEYLESLNIGYKFYIDHHTIFHEETVLYAIVE